MSDNDLKCSVIIPTYNRRELLGHTLDSLTRQTLPRAEFEVIVVDDGSGDATGEMVRGFQDRLRLRYFYQPDEGWRVAHARNIGIRNAAAGICVFIDSGLLLHSGCVAAHVASHEGRGGPSAVIGYVYGFSNDNAGVERLSRQIDPDDPDGTIARLARDRRLADLREEFYAEYTDEFGDLPAPWSVFWTCNVSARTGQIREVGGFDEAFRSWGGEDLDLGYRLHRAGARFFLDRRAAATHLPHEKKTGANEEHATENYRYMARKYDTPVTRLLELDEVRPFTINRIIRQRGIRERGPAEAPLPTGEPA
ncbi:glycosyltransferase [Rhizomonospora bruguierae]|uniref:glycosyltransferase n=1 Tax=Rhizomonospora bruguierae TaxID=1581705 RepID=UPI001BD13C24|nr:glycosyltransferase [Micromonospora sp. NBRC 107566]